MSNPYLSFLASLGGPSGSHSTLKKLAASPSSPASAASAASPAALNRSALQTSHHRRDRDSPSDNRNSSSSKRGDNTPIDSSRSNGSHSHKDSNRSGGSRNRGEQPGQRDRFYSKKSDNHDRDGRERKHIASIDNESSRDSRRTESSAQPPPRARKRHARSRSWSQSPSRSRSPSPRRRGTHDRSLSRGRGRSRSTSRSRNTGLGRSRMRKSRSTSRHRKRSRTRSRSRSMSRGRSGNYYRRPTTSNRSSDNSGTNHTKNGSSQLTNVSSSKFRSRSPRSMHLAHDQKNRHQSRDCSRSRSRSRSPSRSRDGDQNRSRNKNGGRNGPSDEGKEYSMESTLPSAPVTSLQSALDESVSLASLPMLASESLVHPSAVSASAPAPILSLGPAQEASNDTRTPPQASSFLQNVSHGTDLDDTSSFSTLSSPSSFSPSPPYNPTVAHISSAKDLSLSPLKRRRLESHLAGSPTYSSNSSSSSVLSSPSPPRIFHASLEVDLMRPSPVHYDDDMYRKQESDQRVASSEKHRPSMETELFGTASTKLPKKSTAEEKRLTSPLSKKPSTGSDSEEYANLGSKKLEEQTTANSSTIPKGSNGQSRGVAKRPLTRKDSIGPKKELSREVVVIKIGNDVKPLVTVKLVPYTKSKSSNSIKSEVAAKAQKVSAEADSKSNLAVGVNGGSAKSTLTTLTGTGVRRSSILHSDQIVASALSRYKNHFHMLVEDSDSTVASNPSSTGGDMMHVSLQYPEKDSKEKFTLMKPFLSRSKTESDDKDEYNPIEDLVSTVKTIIDHFFSPEKQKALFGTANEGLYRNLTKFKNRKDGAQFLKAVEDFNQIMQDHKSSGMIQQHVQEYGHRLPYDLVVHILGQVYSRTVAARASRLNQYEAFSNNVYGEILPILTKEFIQKTKVNENKVFVDLGCGIGNVVLQVALQTGAESYGVEIMDTPAKFAKKQAKEFEARSRAYGLHHGKVTMIHGDFLETPELAKILARADVVLVNNYAFNSALNQSLLQLFLDLKEGCKIISLKTFVSLDHKINVRNAGSVESILRVRKYPYYTNAVSWTHNGGEYFIATVDRTAVQAFWERAMANGGAGLDDGGRRSSRRR